jgi:hypothetical protein
MKCFNHRATDAVALCACCGRALCGDCVQVPEASRIVCSDFCRSALANDEKLLQLLLQKSTQNARASAFYLYLCGALSAAAAVGAWFVLPSPFLIVFTGACGAVLITSGFCYGRIAKKQTSTS